MMNARTADAVPDRYSASRAQSLLWIEQDIEPVLSPKANRVPAIVGAILRRVHHNEMQLFLDVRACVFVSSSEYLCLAVKWKHSLTGLLRLPPGSRVLRTKSSQLGCSSVARSPVLCRSLGSVSLSRLSEWQHFACEVDVMFK
jgi:hypothetical protein